MSAEAERLARLARLSAMVRAARQAEAQAAAAACAASRALLAALAEPPAPGGDLPIQIEAELRLRYARWADRRRSEVTATLAGQTERWHATRTVAATAIARDEALGRALARARAKARQDMARREG
jgi:hypothetical protein